MDRRLIEILVCPSCKGKLFYDKNTQQLICKIDRLAYLIEDDIPIMLVDEAKKLSLEEVEKLP